MSVELDQMAAINWFMAIALAPFLVNSFSLELPILSDQELNFAVRAENGTNSKLNSFLQLNKFC